MQTPKLAPKVIFFALAIFSATPWCSSGLALLIGILLGVFMGNPFPDQTKNLTSKMLAYSVIGLGAGMNLRVVADVGAKGIGYTASGIFLAALLGFGLQKILKVARDSSILITVGTAICGGSAIAAVAPILGAKERDISISLATVFILNSVALFIFPPLGHHFHLSQEQFGLWSALAIHDTSSVVGATMQYGARALQIGTTVKLARALWIVPVSLIIAAALRLIEKNRADLKVESRTSASRDSNSNTLPKSQSLKAMKKPWFILGFIAMAALVTFIPSYQPAGEVISGLARHLLVLTLFLIGSRLDKKSLREVGARPLLMGVGLWLTIGISTLIALQLGFIRE